ncbi:MAG: SCP2 sterol-binding domain-containing protein [Pseudomonadota bacterium]
MTLDEITQEMKSKVGDSAGLNKVIKFDFGDDGVVRIDDTQTPAVVDNSDGDADTTITVSKDDFEEISSGKQNAQMAFMMGKLQVAGDMGVAMQLGQIFG